MNPATVLRKLSTDDNDSQIARVIQVVEESVSDKSSVTSTDSMEHYQFEIKSSSTKTNSITNDTSADKIIIADFGASLESFPSDQKEAIHKPNGKIANNKCERDYCPLTLQRGKSALIPGSEYVEIKDELNEMRDKYEAVSLQLDFYKTSLLNSEKQLESCINDTEVYKNKIKSYIDKEEEMAKLIAKQTAESETKKQGIKDLKDNILALQQLFDSENQILSNQIEEMKIRLQASEAELNTVVEEKQNLRETALMAKTIEENASQQIKEFQTKLAVLEDKIRDKDKELASSKTDLNSFKKIMSTTVVDLLQQKDKINRDLETKITNLKGQLVMYEEKEKLVADEIAAKMFQCDAYEALVDTGESSATELKAENDILKLAKHSKCKNYKTLLETHKSITEEMKLENDNLKGNIRLVKSRLYKSNAEENIEADSVLTETIRVKKDSSLTRTDLKQQDLEDVTLKLDRLSQELKIANQRIELLNIEKLSLCKSVIIEQQMQDKIRKEIFDHQERSDYEINEMKKAFMEDMKLKDNEIFQLKNKVKKRESKKGKKRTIFKNPIKRKRNQQDAAKTLDKSDERDEMKIILKE